MLASNFPTAGRIARVDMGAVAALVEHYPEDMTASVEAGMTVADFQRKLHACGQWLPIDPPEAENLSIGELLALDVSGPRRLGFGTIRDYLIGIKVALADGTIIKAGGKVVKNVAGYDLCKLFIGARHSLGIILEATFKLRPLPEAERFARVEVRTFDDLEGLRNRVMSSRAEPVLFDAWRSTAGMAVIAAFSGNHADVEIQMKIAREIGMEELNDPRHAEVFFRMGTAQKVSVLPSQTIPVLREIHGAEWFTHLGNGIIYHRGGKNVGEQDVLVHFISRVKNAYDPKGILPTYT